MIESTNQIPIFCINLQRATERKQLMQEHWIDKLQLDITFWNAFDRRDVEKGHLIYPYSSKDAMRIMNRDLSSGEIACVTSFCTLYEYIINNNIKEAIVMEDDITPTFTHKDQLYDIINQGKIEFPHAEMILLHELPVYLSRDVEVCEKIYSIKKNFCSQCEWSPIGNQLFYITNNAARLLLEQLVPISIPADWPQIIIARQNKVIISNNPLCTHEWGSEGSTYIGNQLRTTLRKFIP